jgi:glycerate 2-kinase
MTSRQIATQIWDAGVDAVRPATLISTFFDRRHDLFSLFEAAPRILVVGAGKAGRPMAEALERTLVRFLPKLEGVINVPDPDAGQLKKLSLLAARPVGSNHPTSAGVEGSRRMRNLLASAGKEDVAICLISGGGSALMPLPVEGISLEEKQIITRLLHSSGATIQEMNCVRKHLSAVKGGRLAEAFTGKRLLSLILSDVVGDPLDVIASGPTVVDSSTFQDAIEVIERYSLINTIPASVLNNLRAGKDETCKKLPEHVSNELIGRSQNALEASTSKAKSFGFKVLNLGAFIEGESSEVAKVVAGMVRSIRCDDLPVNAPVCILVGGETTVQLGKSTGKGGRNQEFVLAMLRSLGQEAMRGVTVLSGGTDGEDGPTDAAGGVVDEYCWDLVTATGMNLDEVLRNHDSYSALSRMRCLLKPGLTGTNVMDIRVILIE